MKKTLLVAWAVCAVGALWADVNIGTDTALQADTDWRGQGAVTIAEGVTLDLNGHQLQVDAVAGAGRLTDSKCYELLEYVQATGQQRVPTGYIPGADTMIEVDFISEYNSNHCLYGTQKWAGNQFLCMVTSDRFYFFGSGTYTSIVNGTRYRSYLREGKISLIKHGTWGAMANIAAGQTNTAGTELMYFGNSDNTDFSKYAGRYKLYGSRVWHAKSLRLDLVPARNAATGAVGLFNRVTGALLVSNTATPLVAGAATGATLSVGSLRVAATGGASLASFSGTVDAQVRCIVDGTFQLTADADWSRFPECAIDGSIDLNGHDLTVASLGGTGAVIDSGDPYDHLEYVQSTGRQRVPTGYTPGAATKVEVDFVSEYNVNHCLYGTKKWTSNQFLCMVQNSRFYFFGSGQYISEVNGTRYTSVLENGKINLVRKSDNVVIGQVDADPTNTDNAQLMYFGNIDDTDFSKYPGRYRLYGSKVWHSGELRLDLVPVRNPRTGTVGLLNRVNGSLLVSNTGTPLVAGPVAAEGAAATGGKLRVVVPEGKTNVNAGLSLTGMVSLVKEGAGTLTVMKEAQTYLGGTRIVAGEVNLVPGGQVDDFICAHGYLGKQCTNYETPETELVVEPGAVFDVMGNYDYRFYKLVLAGGTLRNSGHDQAQNCGSFGTATLTADSFLESRRYLVFYDVLPLKLDLGGHTLTANTCDSEIFFRNQLTITNGVVATTGNGSVRVYTGMDARTAQLRIGTALWLDHDVEVGDYYAACTANRNYGAGAMKVYGRFTPATDYFYGCTLQDGSTLDLNERNRTWSTASAFTNGLNRVTFAAGATVTIDAHEYHPWAGKVVDWGEGNAPTDVSFKLDDQSKALRRSLYKRDDGLYAAGGVVMVVR